MPRRNNRKGGKGKAKRKQNSSQSHTTATEQKSDSSKATTKQAPPKKVARSKQPPIYVGIDIGSSYCKVALVQQPAATATATVPRAKKFDPNFPTNNIRIVADDSGNHAIPAVATWSEPNEVLVGYEAVAAAPKRARQCVFYPKTLCEYSTVMNVENDNIAHKLFTRWKDFASHSGFASSVRGESDEKSKDHLVFEVELPFDESKDEIEVEAHDIRDALSAVVRNVRGVVTAQTQSQNVFAVVSCPAWYNVSQKKMLRTVLDSCGFQVKCVIPDCAAISLSYDLDLPLSIPRPDEPSPKQSAMFLLLDLATFTSTATIMCSYGGILESVAHAISTDLCGREIDRVVMNHCVRMFERKTRLEVGGNRKAKLKLRNSVEKAKQVLSTRQQTTIDIESFVEGEPLTLDLSRARFEMLCQSILNSLTSLINEVLGKAHLSIDRIERVCLSGGLCAIPKVISIITKMFGRDDIIAPAPSNLSSQFVNAHGCALQAICLQRASVLLKDIPQQNAQIPVMQESIQVEIVGCRDDEVVPLVTVFTITSGTCLPRQDTKTIERQRKFSDFESHALRISYVDPVVMPADGDEEESKSKEETVIPVDVLSAERFQFALSATADEFSLKVGGNVVYEWSADNDDANSASDNDSGDD